ncbi:MAG: NAD-dependent epimerase/dehydratase family protein [Gelidibacter sp.]
MKRVAIIFGGSGYIGIHLLNELIRQDLFEEYVIADLMELKGANVESGIVKSAVVDVRNTIKLEIGDVDECNSWIFNFAAIHREPGHDYNEYFDTNISGAENINDFAKRSGIKNIFFTSSIAPYGKSISQRTEKSPLYPETAYGISKAMAEKIHQKWLCEDESRRLIIVRPSVIYGPKDPGNVYRMIKALHKGIFVLPNGGKVIKAYGYIFGLVDSIIFTMNKNESQIIYNYAENPVIPLYEMVNVVKNELKITKPTIKLPVSFLAFVAGIFQVGYKIIGKKSDIHPVRVRKASFPTNIKPLYLIENGFNFKYGFQNSLKHWKEVSPEDFK